MKHIWSFSNVLLTTEGQLIFIPASLSVSNSLSFPWSFGTFYFSFSHFTLYKSSLKHHHQAGWHVGWEKEYNFRLPEQKSAGSEMKVKRNGKWGKKLYHSSLTFHSFASFQGILPFCTSHLQSLSLHLSKWAKRKGRKEQSEEEFWSQLVWCHVMDCSSEEGRKGSQETIHFKDGPKGTRHPFNVTGHHCNSSFSPNSSFSR